MVSIFEHQTQWKWCSLTRRIFLAHVKLNVHYFVYIAFKQSAKSRLCRMLSTIKRVEIRVGVYKDLGKKAPLLLDLW